MKSRLIQIKISNLEQKPKNPDYSRYQHQRKRSNTLRARIPISKATALGSRTETKPERERGRRCRFDQLGVLSRGEETEIWEGGKKKERRLRNGGIGEGKDRPGFCTAAGHHSGFGKERFDCIKLKGCTKITFIIFKSNSQTNFIA